MVIRVSGERRSCFLVTNFKPTQFSDKKYPNYILRKFQDLFVYSTEFMCIFMFLKASHCISLLYDSFWGYCCIKIFRASLRIHEKGGQENQVLWSSLCPAACEKWVEIKIPSLLQRNYLEGLSQLPQYRRCFVFSADRQSKQLFWWRYDS